MTQRAPECRSPDTAVRLLSAIVILGSLPLLWSYLDRASLLEGRAASLMKVAVLGTMALVVAGGLTILVFRKIPLRRIEQIVLVHFVVVTVMPGVGKTAGRLALGSDRMVLDSVLQVEVAAGMLLEGRNPYAENYFGTELEAWHQGKPRFALYHLVYPPVPLLATVPVRTAFLTVFGAYDSRILLIPLVIGAFVLCWKRWEGDPRRAATLSVAFANPLLLASFHAGRWDMLVLFLWTLAMIAASRRRFRESAVWLALGALTKTTLLPAAWFMMLHGCRTRREAGTWIGTYAVPCVLVLLPFLAWDAPAFLDDTVYSLAGAGDHPVPIVDSGLYGAAGIVLATGMVSQPSDPFPFWIVQVPVTAVVVFLFTRKLLRNRSLAMAGIAYAGSTATWLHLGRIADLAYFGTLMAAGAIAIGFSRPVNGSDGPDGATPDLAAP